MVQKVIKIGSSIGVTIPKEITQKVGVAVGDMLHIVDVRKGSFRIEKISSETGGKAVDPAVIEWTDAFISKNRELLERLAKR